MSRTSGSAVSQDIAGEVVEDVACIARELIDEASVSACSLRTIAARQSPASQPSVRSVSLRTSRFVSRMSASRKSASASMDETLRSRALSSVRSPWARSRAMADWGRGGSR